ncbi:PQQ-binding-like beta-propeller repeat protein [Adhaeribacter aquaticus]|uniref:outer membrane protein assembly factor BamB family protein n=1 Tax=Adhaeribacter aquaticus TaxID=299567 RepID=UPI000403606E|nr:PQQ-binding-like beta-propeller repeat protein [Adhaeribacter aquaticus]
MKYTIKPLAIGLLLLGSCVNPGRDKNAVSANIKDLDYPNYGGNKAGNRYSPLTQINLENVQNLQIAWEYDASEPVDPAKRQGPKAIQCQPIVVRGVLYGTTPELKLFALDAKTGQQLWRFEPLKDDQKFNTNRGVAYWENGDDRRILYSVGSNLYAIDAKTGSKIESFGKNGMADLHDGLQTGMDHDVSKLSVTATTPGIVYKNTFVVGSSVSESGDAAPGHVRGFDVVTGKLKWVFHTIPQPGEYGYDTWPKNAYKYIGAANNWSGIVLDEKRGTVYFGTGSPASDFYGGDREGANLFATCIMALDAETGKRVWHYQTIHHDLWDRDHPCPPNLTTVKHNGKMVDVVVQATKDGLVYVLNRDTGESLFPVEERPVPTNGLPGEHPYPTQKYPLKPAPFAHQVFTDDDITNISPEAHDYVKKGWEAMRTDHKFTPPNEKGTILFGYSGGAEWGGNSIDPGGILYQNSNDEPWILQMVSQQDRNKEIASVSKGNGFYLANCAVCHGRDRKGSGSDFPSLVNIDKKYNAAGIMALLEKGSGRMPAFSHLPKENRDAIVRFLLNKESSADKDASEHAENGPAQEAGKQSFPYVPQYVNKVWKRFTDQNGYPAIKPPWGTLNAIDLNTGEYLWRVPLGEFPELTKKGIPITGTESYGGPVSTAGGLVFIAATRDERIRAFDKKTGKVVWEYQLPAGGFATPITYMAGGKQYVVIAAGGARGLKPGGKYIAFALP